MGTTALRVRSIESGEVFTSLTRAIESVRSSPSWKASADVSKVLTGEKLEQVFWNDLQVVFHFSNNDALHVELARNHLRFHVSRFEELLAVENCCERALDLHFSKLALVYPWNRAKLLESRLGHRFLRLLESDFGLFIYFEKLPILLFNRIATVDSPTRLLLFWDNCQ